MADHAAHDGASASGAGSFSTGAPFRGSQPARRPNWPAGWRPPSPDDLLNEALLTDARDDQRGQSSGGRGRAEHTYSDDASSPDEPSSGGQSCPELGSSEAAEQQQAAVQPVPKAALAARASQLFNTAAEWPTEVRQPLLATVVTNAVVRDAIEVVADLCDRDWKSAFRGLWQLRPACGAWLAARRHCRHAAAQPTAGTVARRQGTARQ